MKIMLKCRNLCIVAAIASGLSPLAHADSVVNGDFEAGLSGWITADQVGSDGSFVLQTGTASPINGDPVPAPPGGSSAAMTDAQGPGTHVLYQNFTVTAPLASATLVFDLFIGNRAGTFFTPNTLDFSTPALNQQARVDILVGGADPFSLLPADVLQNVFHTSVGDPAVSGYTHFAVDVTSVINAHLNTPLMLRFAETDNVFTFQMGVDNVNLVPEPTAGIMTALGLMGVARLRRRTA